MKFKILVASFSLLILGGCGQFSVDQQDDFNTPLNEDNQIESTTMLKEGEESAQIFSEDFTHQADLVDVTNAQDIRGVNTGGDSAGVAK